jgi:hypothetical protein
MFGTEESRRLAAAVPNGRFALVEGGLAGHDATEELAAIDAFLAELAQVNGAAEEAGKGVV